MRDRIRLVSCRLSKSSMPSAYPIYKYTEEAKLPWLQKLLFKLLHKLGAYEYPRVQTVKTLTLPMNTVFETLVSQAEYSYLDFNVQPKQLIIGSITLYKLYGEPEFMEYIKFAAPGNFYFVDGDKTHIKGFEVTVKVIPWWDGCVLIS